MSKTADALFEYLRALLYAPENARLDLEELDQDFRLLGEGLLYFGQSISELRALARDISVGNLSGKLPPPDNELAAPLKALHASMKHMTWQSQQVAKGDYQQRIDFMGEFADAFNTMTMQLEHRQLALQQEIEVSRKKTLALEQSYSLLEALTDNMQQWIVVLDRKSGKRLFENKAARQVMALDAGFARQVNDALLGADGNPVYTAQEREIELTLPGETEPRYYAVVTYPIHWKGANAIVQVFSDITAERHQVKKLENYAYQDTLTGLHNRFYGMQTLHDWMRDEVEFCICFVDLDNLKYVNDTHGHSEGDRYIIAAAELLRDFSPGAVVSRLGGDEFMVLAPGISKSETERRIGKLRQRMMKDAQKKGKGYNSSMSYGVVAVEEGSQYSASDLLSMADERMYIFKRAHKQGRSTSPG